MTINDQILRDFLNSSKENAYIISENDNFNYTMKQIGNTNDIFNTYFGSEKDDLGVYKQAPKDLDVYKSYLNFVKKINEIINQKFDIEIIISNYLKSKEEKDKIISSDFLKRPWTTCKKDECAKKIIPFIENEINSTPFMVKLLYKSIISVDKSISFLFDIQIPDDQELTGLWENDKNFIKFTINDVQTTSRLIFGFGPSASGKTYNTKKVIELLKITDNNYPRTFLSIDGGIMRECSYVYNIITEYFGITKFAGFKNLGQPNLKTTSGYSTLLFNTSNVKKQMISYLQSQEQKYNLYIPETLSSCGFKNALDCYNTISKYIELTGDRRWTAVLIWQHRHGSECDFETDYACTGCYESGKSRQSIEGKLYSGSSWHHSLVNGYKLLLPETYKSRFFTYTPPSKSIFIHNSPGKKSIISCIHEREEDIQKNINQKNNIEYIIKNNFSDSFEYWNPDEVKRYMKRYTEFIHS